MPAAMFAQVEVQSAGEVLHHNAARAGQVLDHDHIFAG